MFKRWLFGASIFLCAIAAHASAPRDVITLDSPWRFALGHAHDRAKDFNHATGYFSYITKTGFGDGAASASFDDRGWRVVQIPHDWAVEMPIDPRGSASHGYRAVGPGFPESSVGWYRHHFSIAQEDLGRRLYLHFDGIQRDARVFVNGFFLGEENYGNLDQTYDITAYVNYGGDNVIAVRADVSIEAGWYYEGAGINRKVELIKTAPVHVAQHGTFVRSYVDGKRAKIEIDTEIVNRHEHRVIEKPGQVTVKVEHEIVAASGESVAKKLFNTSALSDGDSTVRTDVITLKNPELWDIDNPHLYTLVTRLYDAKKQLLDEYHTRFGVRTIAFDANKGFFLNGNPLKLKGSNNHEDHAGVGTATPDELIRWRLQQLKAIGMNTYRASHAPASHALLNAADELGMLVIDETRLSGINDYHLSAVERLIKRSRNHPSIILWSLGNEEWAIEGNIKGARIAKTMQNYAQRLDPTRLNTIAISGGWGGISTEIAVMGVNYIQHGDTDKQHAEYPWQVILGTEETTTQQTRGIYVEDKSKGHLPPQEHGSSGGNAESGWRHYHDRDYLAGIIYWTGFDYRGEPTPYQFPAISSQFGILDMAGFPKDGASYLVAWWTQQPVLHVFPHWNWAGREGQTIEVRAHTNADAVELFVNGQSQGKKAVIKNDHLAWQVVYQPGELKAVAYRDGKIAETQVRVTTDKPRTLVADAHKKDLLADGHDVAIINVHVNDALGNAHPTADNLLHFSVSGPAKIIGVGNGNPSSHENDVNVESVRLQPIGEWVAPPASDNKTPIHFAATFDFDAATDTRHLLINRLGESQTLRINGKVIYENNSDASARVTLDPSTLGLKPKGNHIEIQATPFVSWQDRETLANFHPANIRIEKAAAPYTRKLFNGLAQVIVQSTREPGDIIVNVKSDGLESIGVPLRSK